ncbi:hypothetical protein HPS12939_0380 [Glaesserella parasuis 12939]|uniref:Uncharacterized protein n=2 Tax=Glaesserella parasuis TaxID=738 RepID=B8F4W5_GLAP5|nr:hypothetical protein HAPS_0721 [Glaesserella parasuis SH0165]AGO15850.1 hypothetical protein K756_03085 [Glaesserella parasuis ZJ0906]EMY46096.1 hypothetical protein OE7_06315 [Glaesserella parasuis gx033]EQA02528.1 hypothetical protein HPSMNH_0508 [Glaesserella parasuis MN-H]EQA02989.1 hypothetical protein HPSNAG_0692 [Glaesserella parasuis str. Nagasaki]EQA06243.1 hypothetical protein HPS12939_0380 [Glaesserella parasuis 12939]EQA09214.1 hypothetical protein HPS8415995_0789 [Glaesserella
MFIIFANLAQILINQTIFMNFKEISHTNKRAFKKNKNSVEVRRTQNDE